MQRFILGLKNWLVAHAGNDHKPHLLRLRSLVVILVLAALVEGLALMQTSPAVYHSRFLGDIVTSVLTRETNQNRASFALKTLSVNPSLEAAAQAKANDMAQKSYFAHTSPEGITPWYWFDKAGYKFSYAGENLAVNFTDSKEVVDAWMNSPGHRANILNGEFKEIGIATANGTYEGKSVVFVVQMFGAPAISNVPVVAPLVKKPTPVAEKAEPVKEMFLAVGPATSSAPTGTVAAAQVSESRSELPVVDNEIRPSQMINVFVLVIALLMASALIIKLIRVGMLHPGLVVNGVVVLMLLTAIVALNRYMFFSAVQIV